MSTIGADLPRRHRSDVFRLLQLLPASVQRAADPLRADMAAVLDRVRARGVKPADLGMKMSAADTIARLAEDYGP